MEKANQETAHKPRKSRESTLHDFFGKVISKRKEKKAGSGRWKEYYALEVEIVGKPEIKEVEVYQALVREEIWEDILQANYYQQNFTFYCIKYGKFWKLRDWKRAEK